MNEFTKEELKELIYGLYCRAKLDGNMANKILYDKLKSMIDNYCEHSSLFSMGDEKHCCKCGKWFK